MSVPVVQLRSRVSNGEALRGRMVTEAEVTLRLDGDCDVYKPNGDPLVMFRKRAISEEVIDLAYPALHELRKYKTDNRGAYAGATRQYAMAEDGTSSKSSRTRTAEGKIHLVASAIVGYFDRQGGRFPFCRETMFTGKFPAEWATLLPMVRRTAEVMKAAAPKRYAKQMEACAKCPPEYLIEGGPFTTLTVNNNVAPAATHTDRGDYKDGIGVIGMVRRGQFTGGWLVFPEYKVGVEMQNGDLLMFNSHDWHGVTPMVPITDDAERITVVYYMREKMKKCLPVEEQLRLLRDKQITVPMDDDEDVEDEG